jgi:Bacterial regulatory proteins, luxR family
MGPDQSAPPQRLTGLIPTPGRKIAKETVRNHVKRLLRRLGASSRVEAVAKAPDAGLI